MQDRNARTITVEDLLRPKKATLLCLIFEGFVDDKPFDGGRRRISVWSSVPVQFIPGFEDQMIGHKAGEEFDVNVPFPDNYHVKSSKENRLFSKLSCMS